MTAFLSSSQLKHDIPRGKDRTRKFIARAHTVLPASSSPPTRFIHYITLALDYYPLKAGFQPRFCWQLNHCIVQIYISQTRHK